MSSWVEDFSMADSIGGSHIASKRSPTKKEQIEAELKLLEWHKLANESAIKAAIMQSKQLKQIIPVKPPNHTIDDAKWMRSVIDQEHKKPLEATKQFVLEYEQREQENNERLAIQVAKHVDTLNTLRNKLQARSTMKASQDEYRQWKKDFSTKKNAIMIGKTLQDLDNEGKGSTDIEPVQNQPRQPLNIKGASKELGTVLDSLSRLAELERRITTLEKDNEYDQLLEKEKPAVNQRTSFEFKKKRIDLGGGAAVGVTYSINPKKTSWNVKVPGITTKAVGGGASAVRAKKGGVFLTADDDASQASEERNIDKIRANRAKELEMASAGQKNLRNRIQAKKARTKEESLGTKKHEQAMLEIRRRRVEQQLKGKNKKQIPGIPSKGASSGIKHKNKHLNDFEKMKAGNKKRTEDIFRNKMGTNTSALSKSAPVGGHRKLTQTLGTVTKRTGEKQPLRRTINGARTQNNTAPTGMVGGIGGIKMLRNTRN